MDPTTWATYKRGAWIVIPSLVFGGCYVGMRACAVTNRQQSSQTVGDFLKYQEQQRAEEEARAAAAASAPRPDVIGMVAIGFKRTDVATAIGHPDAIAVSADHVAWLDRFAGDVVVAARAGGAPRVVARQQRTRDLESHAQALALGGGFVWWITRGSGDGDGAVMRAKIDGGDPETVVADVGGLTAIALDKDDVYFARGRLDRHDDGGVAGGVWRWAPDKDKKPPVRIVAAERPCGIALDASAVYVSEDGAQILRSPKSGGAAQKAVNGSVRCSIATDDKSLYWTGEGLVVRAKLQNLAARSTLLGPTHDLETVTVDRSYAYALVGKGIMRVALDATPGTEAAAPVPILTDQDGLSALAVSGGYVAFATRGGSVVAIEEEKR